MEIYTVHFDGSCGPTNPGGTAACGYTVHKGTELLSQGDCVIGTGPAMSNNLAEFTGLLHGLQATKPFVQRGDWINVRGDSQIVINIMSKKWKPRGEKLYYQAYLRADLVARNLRMEGVQITFDWIPREKNQYCDDLSKAHVSK